MTLPDSIAGYQHIIPEETTSEGDVEVREGKPYCWAEPGIRVGDYERAYKINVYRKIPVAKQEYSRGADLTIIQRAKFALLYQKQAVIENDGDDARHYIGSKNTESPLSHPAILELHGLRLTSACPSSASEAAKINERVDAIYDMTLQEMKQ
jgi:hypothetical protein